MERRFPLHPLQSLLELEPPSNDEQISAGISDRFPDDISVLSTVPNSEHSEPDSDPDLTWSPWRGSESCLRIASPDSTSTRMFEEQIQKERRRAKSGFEKAKGRDPAHVPRQDLIPLEDSLDDDMTASQRVLSIPELLEQILGHAASGMTSWGPRNPDLSRLCRVNRLWFRVTTSISWHAASVEDLLAVRDPRRQEYYAGLVTEFEISSSWDCYIQAPPLPHLRSLRFCAYKASGWAMLSYQFPFSLRELRMAGYKLDWTALEQIPQKYTNLKTLKMDHMGGSGVTSGRIYNLLDKLPHLQVLEVRCICDKMLSKDLLLLVSARKWKKLVWPRKIMLEDAMDMIEANATLSGTKHLRMAIEPDAFSSLAPFLTATTALRLQVNQEHLDELGAISQLTSLRTLTLRLTGSNPTIGWSILTALQHLPLLRSVKIDRGDVWNMDIDERVRLPIMNRREMMEYLSKFPALRIWNLREIYLERESFKHFRAELLGYGYHLRPDNEAMTDIFENKCPGQWVRWTLRDGGNIWKRGSIARSFEPMYDMWAAQSLKDHFGVDLEPMWIDGELRLGHPRFPRGISPQMWWPY